MSEPLKPNAGGSVIACTRCEASTAVHFDRKENLYSSWNDRNDAATRQRFARLARSYGHAAFADCERLGFEDPETGARECALENRGRDCLCQVAFDTAEAIANAILKADDE